MLRFIASVFLVPVFLLFPAHGLFASTVEELETADLCERAEQIIYGRCIGAESFYDSNGMICTRYSFEVKETLKGNSKEIVEHVQPGGIIGNRGFAVAGAATFQPGGESVLFLPSTDRTRPRFTVGLAQGHFAVKQEEATGERVAVQDLRGLTFAGQTEERVSSKSGKPHRLQDLLDGIRRRVEEQKKKKETERD